MASERVGERQNGLMAIFALAAAIRGVIVIFAGKPAWGLLLEASAALLGAAGFVMATLPRVEGGGVTSIIAIVIAIFGIGLSVFRFIGNAMF
jgi:hypothetical protein